MITVGQIISILLSNAPKGVPLTVSDIANIILQHYTLKPQDEEPYTTTRNTEYPKWKHQMQNALSQLKKNNIVVHLNNSNFAHQK